MAQKKDKMAWERQPGAPAGAYVPKKKLGPDIGIRLGKKISLKPKLELIAERNDLTMNDLVIFIFEWFLAERGHCREFSIKIK